MSGKVVLKGKQVCIGVSFIGGELLASAAYILDVWRRSVHSTNFHGRVIHYDMSLIYYNCLASYPK